MADDLFSTLVAHVGTEAAAATIEHFGGMMLYIPKVWTADHALNVMGEAHARALIAHFGGERMPVPRFKAAGPRRTRLIRRLLASGQPVNEIARAADCTNRWVFKVKETAAAQGADQDKKQQDLFD